MFFNKNSRVQTFLPSSYLKTVIPGLRDEAPPSDCKVYKEIDGEKKLIRIERVK